MWYSKDLKLMGPSNNVRVIKVGRGLILSQADLEQSFDGER